MKNYAYIIFIACLSLFFETIAQEKCAFVLKGKVVDCNSNNGLPGAKVLIISSNLEQSTNVDGDFEFVDLCKGTYQLQISYIGYKQQMLTINVSKNIDLRPIILHNDSLFLNEVVISEEKQTVVTTQQLQSLSTKEIDQTRGLSLGETLKKINGVNSVNTGSSISKPMIQGLFGNRILILNNGIRQEGQQWGAEHAPEVDPFIASSISVIKGAGTVRYGNDAIGGVVLIEPPALKDTAGISAEANVVGMSNGKQGVVSGILEGNFKKIKRVSWRLQGTLKKSGNISAPTYILKNTAYEEKNFSGAVKYKFKKSEAEVFYSQFNTSIGIFSGSHIGNLTDLQAAFNRTTLTDVGSFTYKIGRPNQAINHELVKTKYHFDLSEKHHVDIIYARQYNKRMEYDKHRPRNDSLAALNKPELKYEITTHSNDVIWQQKWNRKLNGSIGVNAIYQANTYEGRFFIPNFENKGIGGYAIERYVSENFDVEAGIRYDIKKLTAYYRNANNEIVSPVRDFQGFSGNLGFTKRFAQHLSTNINAGSSWRNPGVNELYSNGLHHGAASIEIGDVDLVSERAYTINTSLKYELKQRIKTEVLLYYNYIQNFLYLQPQQPPQLTIRGAFPAFYFSEADVILKGIDANYVWNINKFISSSSKTSLLWAYNLTAKDYLILAPANRFESEISYNFKLKKLKDNYISLGGLYVAEQKRVPLNVDFAAPPADYLLLNAELGTQLNFKKQSINFIFSCNNLLNKKYRDYLDRFRYYTDAMGRNFTVRIKYKFN